MLKYFNQCNIYIIIWLLYTLQSSIGIGGSIISQLLIFFLILLSLRHLFLVNQFKYLPVLFRGLNSLIIMFSVYGLILIISGENLYIREFGAERVSNHDYLKNIYMSLLPIYSFYFYTVKGYLDHKKCMIWALLFIVATCISFYYYQETTLQRLWENGSNRESVTNNMGYRIVYLLPLLVLFKEKSYLQYSILALIVLLVIFSMKRGAILIGGVSTIYFLYANLRSSKGSKKFIIIILSIAISIIAFLYIENSMLQNDWFNTRLSRTIEGDDSNRGNIYNNLINVFMEDNNIFHLIFGRGAWSTLKVGINYAHQDWLEILINQGMLGIAFFLYFWFCFYKLIKNQLINKDSIIALLLLYIIIFLKTFFSMSYSSIPIHATFIFGYMLAIGTNQDEI